MVSDELMQTPKIKLNEIMFVNIILLTLATLVPYSLGSDTVGLFAIDFGAPSFLQEFLQSIVEDADRLMQYSQDLYTTISNNDLLVTVTINNLPSSSVNLRTSRRHQRRPGVEIAPGVFKTEIISYPPNFFENRLKSLIKIKEKHAAENS